LGLCVGAVLALAILWRGPQWQVHLVRGLNSKDRFNLENEARKTLALILGGVFTLAGLSGGLQKLRLEHYERLKQESVQLERSGQFAERFTTGIEQLGAVDASGKERLEFRLGGIYTLERLANDSEKYYWPIMEVLCTYVRMNAPREPQEPTQEKQTSTQLQRPTTDIQAILTVLGRRSRQYERSGEHLNLSNTDVRGADLRGADLSEADLGRADLRGTDFSEALLSNANLQGALLESANLSGALLNGAYLARADLSDANLRGADFNGADLRQTQGLTQEQIDAAKGDSTMQLPSNKHMPESWKKK
jgi:Pentapeptide repeats (8 copies)